MERHHFETGLRELRTCVEQMGALVAGRLEVCLGLLAGADPAGARFVLDHDDEINNLQVEIDERALKLLALQQPAASDLRFITATIRANSDLERLGDQAVNIAGTTLRLIDRPPLPQQRMIEEMGRMAITMVHDALKSFLDRDVALARDVLERDDQVDSMKYQVLRDLIQQMTQDASTIERAVSLVFVSRNFERAADHATNMAEDAIFMVEAKDVRHRRE
jgi:phosphate transport system protein